MLNHSQDKIRAQIAVYGRVLYIPKDKVLLQPLWGKYKREGNTDMCCARCEDNVKDM